MSDHAKRLAEIEALIAGVPGGVWSWEEHSGSRWTLYVNRGEPIDPDWPAGICNRQHGLNILRGDEGTFDGNGANLRAFIVGAREALSWLLAERRAASDALTAAGITDDGRTLAERVKAPVARGPAPTVDAPEDLYQAHPLIWADRVKAMASVMPEAAAAVFRMAVDRAARVPGLEQANREAHRGIAKLKQRLAGQRCDDCGGTDAPHGHRFGCGLGEEDADVLAAVERCRRGEHRRAGETMPGSCADCGVDWGDLDAEGEPSTGLDVAFVGDEDGVRALVGLPPAAEMRPPETAPDPWLDEPLTAEERAALDATEAPPGAGEPW